MIKLKNRISYSFITLLSISLLLFSCKRKLFEPQWDTKIISPIAHSSLAVKNIVNNSDLISTDQDKLLHIIYSDEVYKIENPLDSFVNLSVEAITTDISLDSLKLDAQKISDTLVIGDLINQFPSGNPRPSDGSNLSIFLLPIVNALLSTQTQISNEIDISSFLEEAILKEAFLDLSIANNTNFQLLNLSLKLSNAEDNTLLYEELIPIIEPHTKYTKIGTDIAAALAGKPIKGKLILATSGFELGIPSGKTSAVINYTDNIIFNAILRDIKVLSAKAVFPAQELVNETDTVGVITDNGVEIVFARIDSGAVNVKGYSTIPTDILFTYSVPNITKNGQEFSFSSTIDDTYNSPENAGDTNFYFNGFNFDFSVDQMVGTKYVNKKYNTFVNHIIASIEESSGVIDLALTDKIFVDLKVIKLKPSYVRGYLGSSNERIKQTIKIDAFKNVSGGLNFDKVNLELELLNDIGVQGLLQLYSIKAINTKTGQTAIYSKNMVPFVINPATESGDNFVTQKSSIQLNDVASLLSILPDEFEIDMELVLNKGYNDEKYTDFIHSNASFKANFNLDIPLVISASGLQLSDTSIVNLSTLEFPAGINNGVLSLVVDNGFPLDADLDLYFTSKGGLVLKAFSSDQIINAAKINSIDNKVSSKTKTRIDYSIDYDDMQLLKYAEKMIVKVKFDTPSMVPFYDYYTFDVQVIADFGFQVNKAK